MEKKKKGTVASDQNKVKKIKLLELESCLAQLYQTNSKSSLNNCVSTGLDKFTVPMFVVYNIGTEVNNKIKA